MFIRPYYQNCKDCTTEYYPWQRKTYKRRPVLYALQIDAYFSFLFLSLAAKNPSIDVAGKG
jgi:hypothetical protein